MAQRFRAFAIAAAASLYVIIITGALVRLTASGLGCDSWPGCQEGAFFPAEDHHGFIEFGNRVFGAIPITLTFLTWLASRRVASRFVQRVALATFLLTLVQAPIGLVVIATDLEPDRGRRALHAGARGPRGCADRAPGGVETRARRPRTGRVAASRPRARREPAWLSS